MKWRSIFIVGANRYLKILPYGSTWRTQGKLSRSSNLRHDVPWPACLIYKGSRYLTVGERSDFCEAVSLLCHKDWAAAAFLTKSRTPCSRHFVGWSLIKTMHKQEQDWKNSQGKQAKKQCFSIRQKPLKGKRMKALNRTTSSPPLAKDNLILKKLDWKKGKTSSKGISLEQ